MAHPLPLLAAPESLLRLACPLPLLAPHHGHQHLVAQQVALVAGLHLHRQVLPLQGDLAVELCSGLLVGVVGEVEGLAVPLLAEHVRSIWFLQCGGEE